MTIRKLSVVFLFIVTFIGLGQASADNSKTNLALVDQYFAHFNNHDWEKLTAMYSDPAQFKDPSIGTDMVTMSHGEVIGRMSGLGEYIPDVKIEIVKTYPSSDHVTVEFLSSGTTPDGATYSLPIAVIFKFENGLITEDYSYFDNN